ncbi:MAG: EMC3/TMCO1 family protein [Candidatus Diapherotrites archaeon]|nr:EMC3/TMCO1 family protein [Candidatus Diapherotrites archaeon]
MIISPIVDISLVSVAIVIILQIIQNKIHDRKKMKEQRDKMTEKQKRLKELMKNFEKNKKEIDKLQNELLLEMNEMLSKNLKFMLVSLVLALPTFWYLGSFYSSYIIDLPIPVPWFGKNSLIEMYKQTNWLGWYVLSSLFTTLIINIFYSIKDKIEEKKG